MSPVVNMQNMTREELVGELESRCAADEVRHTTMDALTSSPSGPVAPGKGPVPGPSDADAEPDMESERALRMESERTGRIKDEFLATLSHELRTPLNAILGWSQLLKSGRSSAEDLAEGLDVIERNARMQAGLIDDMLDMSRIITGKLRLDVQRVDLPAVIAEAVDAMRLAAEAKGLRLDVIVDPLAGPVTGDPNRLRQVVSNLLSNAVKFTPERGRVQVTLERLDSQIELSVSDTGIGIDPDFLPFVFEKFRQAESALTRRNRGLGLGLAIVKHLAELHGGTVRAKSPGVDKGATFILSLPLSIVRTLDGDERREHPGTVTESEPFPDPDLTGIRVLVVDDEPDALALAGRVLGKSNAAVTTCTSGAACLEVLGERKPHVLLADIGMRGMDGYALIRRVRALSSEQGGHIAAVAVTAFARSEDRRRALLAGFDMHVAKPVEPAELVAVVARLGRRG